MSFLSLFSPICESSDDSCGWVVGITLFLAILGLYIFIIIAYSVFSTIARWIYFKKCGEAGWKSLIPVYGDLTLFKTAGLSWWWIFFMYAAPLISGFVSFIEEIQTSYLNDVTYSSLTMILLNLVIIFASLIGMASAVITRISLGINISKKFNKTAGTAVLYAFFPNIMSLVLGISKNSVYNKDAKVSPNGIFGPKPSN